MTAARRPPFTPAQIVRADAVIAALDNKQLLPNQVLY